MSAVVWEKPNPNPQEAKVIGLLKEHFTPGPEFSGAEIENVLDHLPEGASLCLNLKGQEEIRQAAEAVGIGFRVRSYKGLRRLRDALLKARLRRHVADGLL